MKPGKTILVLLLLLAGGVARAQSGVPSLPGVVSRTLNICHVDVVSVLADDLGPDIYGTVPWLGDVSPADDGPGFDVDPYVKIGTCVGACLEPWVVQTLDCVPAGYRPVRIEAHIVNEQGDPEVVYLFVYVPDECECRDQVGPVIGSYYVNPNLDVSLAHFAHAMHGPSGNGGAALKGMLTALPEMDANGAARAFAQALIGRVRHAMVYDGAPYAYLQASTGEIPLTPALMVQMEMWLWTAFSAAVLDTADEFDLSASSQSALVQALDAQFPQLF